MAQRLRLASLSPEQMAAMTAFSASLAGHSLDEGLMELVKVRASQLNGCAYCIALHVSKARQLGESDDRLHLLGAWAESPGFTDRERAALLWTEALTNIQDGHASDEVYEQVRAVLTEVEVADLTMVIANINAWNRIQIANRAVPRFT